ncbi:MAG TPA: BMP family ABC transporter substrate-binding protein [Sulfolobales archaeon]|nr:BMP family ABC transporter substrate-binding protein [Sulfolobales archaeon]
MGSPGRSRAVIAILVVSLVAVAAVAGFFAGRLSTEQSRTPATTVPATTTLTVTASPRWTPPEKIRAAFIYVGPIGDYGWTYAHDLGRRVVAELFKDWLETTYVESVPEAKALEEIDRLVKLGYNVIFTTSFEFMDATIEASKRYPEVLFFHASGYKRSNNVGTYFADFYQIYYLNGLMAGALTKTGKIGYIAAFTIPEVVRHINAFAIGAREIGEQLGKNIEVYVVELGSWVAPEKAKASAEYLVKNYNVDVIAFTEDTTAVVEFAQTYYKSTGKQLYVFSHYSPMYIYGPDVVVSGQLVRWEVIYADLLIKIRSGVLTPYNLANVDYWYLLNTGAVELGAHIYENGTVMKINPRFVPELKGIKVKDKLTGEDVSAYELVLRRYEQMRSAPLLQPLQFSSLGHRYEHVDTIYIGGAEKSYKIAPLFEPFTGPLKGYCLVGGDTASSKFCKGKSKGSVVSIAAGERLTHDDLWSMDWFVEWVRYLG